MTERELIDRFNEARRVSDEMQTPAAAGKLRSARNALVDFWFEQRAAIYQPQEEGK